MFPVLNETTEIICKEIQYGSDAYKQSVVLRHKVLRAPLGLTLSREELGAENSSFHVTCWAGDKLAACVVLKPLSEKQIKMRQFAVSEEFRGLGIGRALAEYAEVFVGELGCSEMVLHARESAAGFYERLGYTREGERFSEVTLPHYAMRKFIG